MASEPTYDFDIIVIGGGSGGVACARQCAHYGAKVAVFDFVKPSPRGTKWGLGGTCVNVGCIPKKLMHRAAAIGGDIHDAPFYGWTGVEPANAKIDWEQLIMAVQNHVHKTNFSYRNELRDLGITYINAYASFKDPHTVEYVFRRESKTATAKYIVIACGGRPTYPDIPGAKECCITSDDFFTLDPAPGKTLCVGASYISLECAGVLTELGYDTTVMVRSVLLRGFDQEIAVKIGAYMEAQGTKFQRGQVPVSFTKQDSGRILVKSTGSLGEKEEEFDTILLATGRHIVTEGLNLANAGVHALPSGKVPVDRTAATNVPHIFCIGDAQEGATELTPTAILSGRILASRLFNGGQAVMEYDIVPTTVFTPLEYGVIGISEEKAIEKYGADNVVCYISSFNPLEWSPSEFRSHEGPGFVKYVCETSTFSTPPPPPPGVPANPPPLNPERAVERIVGLHYLGPNAAEVINGWGPALRMHATKADFERVVGIHPSTSEEVSNTRLRKDDPEAQKGPSGC